MPNIVIIEKNGDMKNMNIKTFAVSDLFKKAGFKTPTNFDCHTVWNIQHNNKDYSIELHAKNTGRANQENKYEFPPPVDKILFFGSCVLINRKSPSEIDDLYVNEWKSIYEVLFGGFEDLNEEESEDEDREIEEEREAAKNSKLTKTGYLNDGFVVEDDTNSEGLSIISDEESEEDEKSVSLSTLRTTGHKSLTIPFNKDKSIKVDLTVLPKSKNSPAPKRSERKYKVDIFPSQATEIWSSPSLRSSETLNFSEGSIEAKNEFIGIECKKVAKNSQKKTISKNKNTNKKNTNKKDEDQKNEIDIYLNCENELVEEDYI